MNLQPHTPTRTHRRSRLLTVATWAVAVAGPLGYLVLETAGGFHP
jgi:hypothetical protein